MKDNYEHIHQATDKRLAEMIRQQNDYRKSATKDKLHTPPPYCKAEWDVILDEAARRLEAYKNRPEQFNSEQFNL